MNLLNQKLDYFSIQSNIDDMINPDEKLRKSEHYSGYEELLSEISGLAVDLYERLQKLVMILLEKLPFKKCEFYTDDESSSGISWFNTCIALFEDTDMAEMLKNEEMYDFDETQEKQKRFKAIESLTKKDMLFIFCTVSNFVFDFKRLQNSFAVVVSVIEELDYNNSFTAKDNIPCEMAWVV